MFKDREGSHCRACAFVATGTHLKITSGWSRRGHGDADKKERQCNWWCAACGDQYNWKNSNRILVFKIVRTAEMQKFYQRTHALDDLAPRW